MDEDGSAANETNEHVNKELNVEMRCYRSYDLITVFSTCIIATITLAVIAMTEAWLISLCHKRRSTRIPTSWSLQDLSKVQTVDRAINTMDRTRIGLGLDILANLSRLQVATSIVRRTAQTEEYDSEST